MIVINVPSSFLKHMYPLYVWPVDVYAGKVWTVTGLRLRYIPQVENFPNNKKFENIQGI